VVFGAKVEQTSHLPLEQLETLLHMVFCSENQVAILHKTN